MIECVLLCERFCYLVHACGLRMIRLCGCEKSSIEALRRRVAAVSGEAFVLVVYGGLVERTQICSHNADRRKAWSGTKCVSWQLFTTL